MTLEREHFEHKGYAVLVYKGHQWWSATTIGGGLGLSAPKFFGPGARERARKAIVEMIDARPSGTGRTSEQETAPRG